MANSETGIKGRLGTALVVPPPYKQYIGRHIHHGYTPPRYIGGIYTLGIPP